VFNEQHLTGQGELLEEAGDYFRETHKHHVEYAERTKRASLGERDDANGNSESSFSAGVVARFRKQRLYVEKRERRLQALLIAATVRMRDSVAKAEMAARALDPAAEQPKAVVDQAQKIAVDFCAERASSTKNYLCTLIDVKGAKAVYGRLSKLLYSRPRGTEEAPPFAFDAASVESARAKSVPLYTSANVVVTKTEAKWLRNENLLRFVDNHEEARQQFYASIAAHVKLHCAETLEFAKNNKTRSNLRTKFRRTDTYTAAAERYEKLWRRYKIAGDHERVAQRSLLQRRVSGLIRLLGEEAAEAVIESNAAAKVAITSTSVMRHRAEKICSHRLPPNCRMSHLVNYMMAEEIANGLMSSHEFNKYTPDTLWTKFYAFGRLPPAKDTWNKIVPLLSVLAYADNYRGGDLTWYERARVELASERFLAEPLSLADANLPELVSWRELMKIRLGGDDVDRGGERFVNERFNDVERRRQEQLAKEGAPMLNFADD
jgi:hypothetical protein